MQQRCRCAGRNPGDAAEERRGARASGRGSGGAGRRDVGRHRCDRPRALFLEAADPASCRRARSTARCRRCGCTSASMPIGRKRSSFMRRRRRASSRLLEGLEQLRFLDAGVPVAVVDVDAAAVRAARAQQSRGCRADRAGACARRASNERHWTTLDPKYRLILCDIWGVVHDGVTLYPGAAERLRQWRDEGRCVILITNAPRTADAVTRQLARLGLPRDCWDGIATSGEAGIEALNALRAAGRLRRHAGRPRDPRRAWRSDRRRRRTSPTSPAPAITEDRPDPQDYRADLERWAATRRALMHCLNPDRVVMRGGVLEACAGAIADLYEQLGGRVTWYGKPHAADLSPRAPPRRRSAGGRGAGDWRWAADRHAGCSADGFRRDLRQRRNPRRRAVPDGFRGTTMRLATGARSRSLRGLA